MKLSTMNRVLAAVLALGMTAALAGCGSTASSEATAESAATEETAASSATEETAEVDESAYDYLADFSFSQAYDDKGYLKDVTALDYVTLPDDYADITVDADLGQVTDESATGRKVLALIEKGIAAICAHTNLDAADEKVTDRAAADGDTVNIDYVGSVDGVEFNGGNTQGNGADLTLGSHSYIDDFEDQIVGHMPGESFDVTVTFPEDYGPRDLFEKAASLRGEYVIAAKGLVRERESKNPDLTDDWVASNLGETMNLNTIDELNDFVKNTMLYDQQASTVYSALHDKVSFAKELPQSVLDYYRDVVLYRVYSYAKNYGTTMTTLLKSGMLGTSYDSIDAYLEDIQGSLNTITEQALLMQAIAEKQGLVCDTALMNQDFGKFYGTTDPSAYISSYGENYIKMNVLQSEVMQGLIDNVKYK